MPPEHNHENVSGTPESLYSSTRFIALFLVVLSILFLFMRLRFINIPLHRDEGLYGYIAQEIFRGKTPVLDIPEIKFPLAYYCFAIPLLLFGKYSIVGIRIAAMFVWLSSVIMVFFITKNLLPKKTGVWFASCAFMFLCSISMYLSSFVYYTEIIAQFFFLISVLFFTYFIKKPEGKYSNLLVLLSGFFWMAATMTRQTHLVFILLFAFFMFSEKKEKEGKGIGFFKISLYFIFGSMLNVLLVAILLGFKNLIPVFQMIMYLSKVCVHSSAPYFSIDNLKEIFDISRGFFIENSMLVIFTLGGILLMISPSRRTWSLLVWLICGSMTMILSTLHFGRNFTQIAPILCILGGFFIAELFAIYKDKIVVKTGLIVLILIGLFLFMMNIYPFYFKYSKDEVCDVALGAVFREAVSAGDYIKSSTTSDDYIYNWGVEWEIYFYTGRRASSRHVCLNYFLRGAYAIYRDRADILDPFVPYQIELLIDLNKNKPKYIIITSPFYDYNLREYFLPNQFRKFLDENYVIDENYKGKYFTIFKEREKPANDSQ